MSTERPILFSGDMVKAILDGRKTQTRRVVSPRNSRVDATWDRLVLEHAWVDPGGTIFGPGPYLKVPAPILDEDGQECDEVVLRLYPRWEPGDRLWVRETWAVGACADGLSPAELDPGFWREFGGCWYRADGRAPDNPISPRGKWRPSIFCPRWASRLTLEIVSVRVEKLQAISEEDAVAEGVREGDLFGLAYSPSFQSLTDERNEFADDLIYGHRGAFACLWDTLNAKRGFGWEINPFVWCISFRRITNAGED